MAKIETREQLKEYCLRRLGAPVISINVSTDQIEDRIEDAFDFFNEFHYESTARILHKHVITAEDRSNRFIDIPAEIIQVHRILPLGSASSSINAVDQMQILDFLDLDHMGTSLQYWAQWQEHNRMMQLQLSGAQQEIDFSRYGHTLQIHVDWNQKLPEGTWVVVDAERLLLDPDSDVVQISDVYNDQFLKEYATALIKLQWGTNLAKFSGIQMPGGVTFDGERILNEAREDIIRIKEEARNVWQQPLGLWIG